MCLLLTPIHKMELSLIGTVLPVILAVVVGILLYICRGQKGYINLPPGPKGYPIIGNLLDIPPAKVLETFRRFRKEYGDLFCIYLGTNLTVVVNGYDNLKELFSKKGDAVSDRPTNFIFHDVFRESGIVSSSGALWKAHRAFTMRTMREFGFGKRSIESNIMEEVNVFLTEIEKQNERSINLNGLINTCVSNVICSIAFGERFDLEDSRLIALCNLLDEIFKNAPVSGPIAAFPLLKYLPGDPFAAKQLLTDMNRLRKFVENVIDEHKTSFDPENTRDYIDVYLKEKKGSDGQEKDTFTDEQLRANVTDVFGAGTETTATSLKWIILYLLHNQDVQQKMTVEIKSVIGTSNLPSLNDKPNLPYCEAVITEVMRCANVVPLSVPHSSNKDVQLNGYTIPKGSVLIQNLDSVMKDPELFPNPEEFQPERFIDAEGNLNGQDMVIPFSIGRRVCLGESLARAELFLFSTSLIQRFKLSPVEGKPLPPLQGNVRALHTPDEYELMAMKRQ